MCFSRNPNGEGTLSLIGIRPAGRRPVLPTCKTSSALTAIIFTLFKANTKETTKEVARPKAAPPLLWWRPKAATFVCALNGASILALSTIYDLRLSKTGRTVVGRTFDWMDGWSDAVPRLSGSFFNWYYPAQKANGQAPCINVYLYIIGVPFSRSRARNQQCPVLGAFFEGFLGPQRRAFGGFGNLFFCSQTRSL